MHLICLCPTYGRPTLVANSLALFLRQQLPAGDTADLLIFDDANQMRPQSGRQGDLFWQVRSQAEWIPLTRKYGPMIDQYRGWLGRDDAAFVVWDDDDIYLPWHLAAHGQALRSRPWSHPSRAWTTSGIDPLHQPPVEKRLDGRSYHAAAAFRADLLGRLGGYPDTDQSDYDRQQLARCWSAAGPPGDPCASHPPSFVHRWRDTHHPHASARTRDGRYQTPPRRGPAWVEHLRPVIDASAQALLDRLAAAPSPSRSRSPSPSGQSP